MQFDSLSALVSMGGHGPYVWASYAIFVLVVVLNLYFAWRSRRQTLDQLLRQMRRESQATRPGAQTTVSDTGESPT